MKNMKLLLDTHTVIWYILDSPRLPDYIRQMLKNGSNEVYVSVVSPWEISIKSRKGHLNLNQSLSSAVRLLRSRGFRLLPVRQKHVFCLDTLKLHHKDPFDRMLVAQSLAENFPLVGNDEVFDLYGIRRLW